tara:strand:+ start:574 stop:738 length:165 start_codon:yes stop_codon:yes gene_type:complete
MTLLSIQTEIVARISAAPIGSTLRFALMDTASAMSRAIEAEGKALTQAEKETAE